MCKSKESSAKDTFRVIHASMSNYGVLWDKCVLLGVDNTSVNLGRYNSIIVEASKKNNNIVWCDALVISPTMLQKRSQMHSQFFSIEELLVDIHFFFDCSSKWKSIFAEFCDFCDQDYNKILKFNSVHWLGMEICI